MKKLLVFATVVAMVFCTSFAQTPQNQKKEVKKEATEARKGAKKEATEAKKEVKAEAKEVKKEVKAETKEAKKAEPKKGAEKIK